MNVSAIPPKNPPKTRSMSRPPARSRVSKKVVSRSKSKRRRARLYVGWFQVAVQHAFVVRDRKPGTQLACELHGLISRQASYAVGWVAIKPPSGSSYQKAFLQVSSTAHTL